MDVGQAGRGPTVAARATRDRRYVWLHCDVANRIGVLGVLVTLDGSPSRAGLL